MSICWQALLRLLLPVLYTMTCLSMAGTSAWTHAAQNAPEMPSANAPLLAQPQAPVELDRQMANALEAMIAGDTEAAARIARSITARYPDFALAQLLSGELQALAALDPLQVSFRYTWSPRLVNLLLEARRRLEQSAVPDEQADLVPAAIIQAGDDADEILLVDISDSTLYWYENRDGALHLRQKHYVSSGRGGAGKQLEGDLKTPIGLYRITESLVDAELPALYGHGALVLDYPNLLDRRLGRTGHGIWLHGNPAGQLSRAPYSSEGCVTMTNEHVAVLMKQLPLMSTQVILSETVTWHTRVEAAATRKDWLQRFATWRSAWLDGDIATLERLYHPSARPGLLEQRARESSPKRGSKAAGHASTIQSDEPLLDVDARKRLQGLKPRAISILASPQGQGESETPAYVKMSLPWDQAHASDETTLWWFMNEQQQWQVVAEQRDHPAL